MNKQRGASIYFALDILAIMMAIIIGVTTVIVVQLANIKEAGDSVVAFYAADSGIEASLYSELDSSGEFYNDDNELIASYSTTIVSSSTDPSCTGLHYCIRSIGVYDSSDIRRGIQINR